MKSFSTSRSLTGSRHVSALTSYASIFAVHWMFSLMHGGQYQHIYALISCIWASEPDTENDIQHRCCRVLCYCDFKGFDWKFSLSYKVANLSNRCQRFSQLTSSTIASIWQKTHSQQTDLAASIASPLWELLQKLSLNDAPILLSSKLSPMVVLCGDHACPWLQNLLPDSVNVTQWIPGENCWNIPLKKESSYQSMTEAWQNSWNETCQLN